MSMVANPATSGELGDGVAEVGDRLERSALQQPLWELDAESSSHANIMSTLA